MEQGGVVVGRMPRQRQRGERAPAMAQQGEETRCLDSHASLLLLLRRVQQSPEDISQTLNSVALHVQNTLPHQPERAPRHVTPRESHSLRPAKSLPCPERIPTVNCRKRERGRSRLSRSSSDPLTLSASLQDLQQQWLQQWRANHAALVCSSSRLSVEVIARQQAEWSGGDEVVQAYMRRQRRRLAFQGQHRHWQEQSHEGIHFTGFVDPQSKFVQTSAFGARAPRRTAAASEKHLDLRRKALLNNMGQKKRMLGA